MFTRSHCCARLHSVAFSQSEPASRSSACCLFVRCRRIVALLLACTAPVSAQAAQAEKPESLGPVVVSPPQRKPVRRAESGNAAQPQPRRAAAGRPHRRPRCLRQPQPASGGAVAHTPLNTNVVAESASRLGLTVREMPATVEVIDQQTIRDRGLRTMTEVAQARSA